MYMLHYDPFRELRGFHGRRGRGWRGFNQLATQAAEADRWLLPVDVVEREDGVAVTASVPGVRPEDLEVTIEDNILTIHGKSAFTEETRDERFLVRERRSGDFRRSIRVPESVNAGEAATHYEHGVLTITLPKAEEKKARKLTVSVNGS